jgi:hypothetical protein
MEITDMSIGNLLLGSATFTQSEIHFEIAFTCYLAIHIAFFNNNLCQPNDLFNDWGKRDSSINIRTSSSLKAKQQE